MQEIDYLRLIAFILSLNLTYQFMKDIKAAINKCIDNLSRREKMNDLMNQIASAGDINGTLPEMRILVGLFLFTFIIIVMSSIFIALKNLGGKG